MKQVALDAVARGFPVIPLRPNTKIPAAKGWEQNALTDAFDVHEQWPAGAEYNVGVATGRGLVVIDVDYKPEIGRDGFAGLQKLPPLPDTFAVRTPSGGKHYYFRTPDGQEFGNSANRLAPGIDVRGAGGQVVAPGSIIGGKSYVIEKDVPVAPLPGWLAKRLNAAPQRDVGAGKTIGELDTPLAIERAKAVIAKAAPALEGQGGNDTTYRLSVKLWNLGISEDAQIELLDKWNERCEPPWDDDDLRRIVRNAHDYNKGGIGRDNPSAGVATVDGPPPKPTRLKSLADISLNALSAQAANSVVDGVLERGKLTVIAGDSTAGKSFLTLDMLYAVAQGRDWHGLKVKQGPVLIVCLEGAAGYEKRVLACQQKFGSEGADRNFGLLASSLLLARNHDGDLGEEDIFAAVRELEARAGEPVAAIVVDTLQRAMAGDDENSASDMSMMVRRLDRIRDTTGAALAICHHVGKNGTVRGSSVLRASADVLLVVQRRGASKRLVTTDPGAGGKPKDGKEGDLFLFDLQEVSLGTDETGKVHTSAVVRKLNTRPTGTDLAADMMQKKKKDTLQVQHFREAASTCVASGLVERIGKDVVRADTETVRDQFFACYPVGDRDPKKRKKTLERYWRTLCATPPDGFLIRKNGSADVFEWPCPEF